jgi:endonuclease III
MTAAVEGVSEQCKMLAKEMDDSFRKMVTLIDWPTSQNNAYPTPYPSSNEDVSTCPVIPPTQELQSAEIGPTNLCDAEPSTDERRKVSDRGKEDDNRSEFTGAVTPPARKRKIRSITVSPYFPNSAEKKIKNTASPYFPKPPNTKSKAGDRVSCIPFPPLSSTSFGLVQERLAHDPFRLLVAMIFLNKTRGAIALPVFYELMERYPTPADLAAADLDDVVDIFEHLGLQNQRAMKCINLAKAWLERPPGKGKRYRVLHYPNKDDGKDIKADEILDEDDERVAWEIGQLPGVGAYAIDSWRIFCRDELRGLPNGLPKSLTPDIKECEMQKEWTRVLPLDKELRAYLHWRWLRNGWDWNPVTGEKIRADKKTIADAGKGGVTCEGAESSIVFGENKSRVSASEEA